VKRLGRMLGWWAKDYAYAAYWQVRAFVGPRDALRFRTGSGRPVVMLPGIWETWSFLRPLVKALHRAGHPVHVLPGLRRNGRPVADTARAVSAHLGSSICTTSSSSRTARAA
jgi:hypothetical protein